MSWETETAVQLVPMTMEHYPAVFALWQQTPGVVLRQTDSAASIARYLTRNPGLSVVAMVGDEIIGSIMAGHDGRRGFLQHAVVVPAWRDKGIARSMQNWCLEKLTAEQVMWVHLDVTLENTSGQSFWRKHGWEPRAELLRLSIKVNG